MLLKPRFQVISLSAFVILLELEFARFKYMTILILKHSLSSIFWILIKPSLAWFDFLGNFILLLPAKGLYFEILIVIAWSMTESIIYPERFPKDFYMFDIILE